MVQSYVSRNEAAAYLRCQPQQIDRLAKAGKITALKLSRKKTLYLLSQIDTYVQSCAVKIEGVEK